jgi:hypothetical protein
LQEEIEALDERRDLEVPDRLPFLRLSGVAH